MQPKSIELETAMTNYRAVNAWYKQNRVYDSYKLSPIWQCNIEQHFNRILIGGYGDGDPRKVIAYLHDKWFFDISVPQPKLRYALDWFERFLKRHGDLLARLPVEIGESDLFADTLCEVRSGRRVSADFLWRLCLIERLERVVPLGNDRLTVVELGSGSGNFARAFRLLRPNTTYVCIDLPESLFFAHLFLMMNFPEARVLYITEGGKPVEELTRYDFVFIPTEFASAIAGNKVDLFVNMNSLGEMNNAVIAHWFDFITNRIDVRYLFLLNRFLNRIPQNFVEFRQHESSCSLAIGDAWEMLDWEVDPDFERCPYSTLVTRNLLMIARRYQDKAALNRHWEEISAQLPALQLEDWMTRPYWDNYVLKHGGKYPPANCRGDVNFTVDLTRSGSLYVIWEHFRLTRAREAAYMLAVWMVVHGGTETPFEESLYLLPFVNSVAA